MPMETDPVVSVPARGRQPSRCRRRPGAGQPRAVVAVVATLALVMALTGAVPAHADSSYWEPDDIDTLVEDYRTDNSSGSLIPGISVAVVEGGETVYADGFGYAHHFGGSFVDATAESVYLTASVSKVIGATLAAKLEADPTVDLDLTDATSDYLPVEKPDDADDWWVPVHEEHVDSHTLEDLLWHLGCVPHYDTTPGIENTVEHYPSATQAGTYVWEERLLDDCTIGLGADYSYSTHSFTLLGAALEHASGQNISDLLQDELFAPHGLDSLRAQFAEEELPDNPHRVTPFSGLISSSGYQDNSWKVLGGGIEGNAIDLAHFGWLVANGDFGDDVRDRLWDPHLFFSGGRDRSLGWWVGADDHGRQFAEHGGSWTGARAWLRVYQDDDVAISVLTNRTSHSPADLVDDIADVVLYAPPEVTAQHGSVSVDEGDVAQNSGTISTVATAEIEASTGVVEVQDDSWSWEWQTADGPDSREVTITVTDDRGEQDTVAFDVEVQNVAPTVEILSVEPATTIDENDTVDLVAEFTDPGWKDTHEVEIDWGVPDGHPGKVVDAPSVEILDDGGPGEPRRGEVTATYQYGDDDGGDGFEVVVTVEDKDGGVGSDSFDLTVDNVAPTVEIRSVDPATTIDEGETVTVVADVTDPGWLEDLTLDVDWGVPDGHPGELIEEELTILEEGGPDGTVGEVTATYQYGDTGEGFDGSWFEVVVTVEDKDGDVGSDSFDLTVNNVAPTIEHVQPANEETVPLADGGTAIMGQADDPLDFNVTVTDPGSDDLTLDADFGDGTTGSWLSLANDEPEPEDHPSPEVGSRNKTFQPSHTYTDACAYRTTFTATDDDGGVSEPATTEVIITGTADRRRGAGFWLSNYHQRGRTEYTPETLTCFLDIAGQLSNVFDEEVAASTLEDAAEVLHSRNARGVMTVQLDRQLLAAWVNLASGAIGYSELVDTTGDGVGDSEFSDVLDAAETARLDPDAHRVVLETHKDILEQIITN